MSSAMRVLIADDDAMIRDVLKEVLDTEADMEVVAVAADADEAIRLAAQVRPAVAVLDIRMPGGGARAAHEIAVRLPGTAILAFSAYTDRLALAELRTAGVSEYLAKGVPNTQIVETVRRLGRLSSGKPAC